MKSDTWQIAPKKMEAQVVNLKFKFDEEKAIETYASGILEAPITDCFILVNEVEHFARVHLKNNHFKIIKEITKGIVICENFLKLPWPMSNR